MQLDVLFFFIIVFLLTVISYLVFFKGDRRKEPSLPEEPRPLRDNTQELQEINLSKIRADIERKNELEQQRANLVPKSIEEGDIPIGCFQFTHEMVIRFTDLESGEYTEVAPKIDKPMLVGRNHESLSIQPDIDLTPFLREPHGVSRRHAMIRLRDLRLEMQDLDSRNGTGINGFRFLPKETHQIRNGDVISFGRTKVQVSFLRKESVPAKV